MRVGILAGPTATGKTELALDLAQAHGSMEIINADSLLVYRGMNIGTAKPHPEELQRIRHHLIDIRNPDETFTAGDFLKLAMQAIEDIHLRGKRVLIVGATGFYLKALLYGLWKSPPSSSTLRAHLNSLDSQVLYKELQTRDHRSAQRIGIKDRYRLIRALEIIQLSGKTPSELQSDQPMHPDHRFEVWWMDRTHSDLLERIKKRTQHMLEIGLLEEVQGLLKKYSQSGEKLPRPFFSVGYRQAIDYLKGIQPHGRKISPGIEGLQSEIELATRQLVKRQRTWFRAQGWNPFILSAFRSVYHSST